MHLVDVIGGSLAVVGETDAEYDGVDTIEQVEPLPPLRPLTTNVMDTKYHVLQASISVKPDRYLLAAYFDVELDLHDARCPDPGVEDVLGAGDVAVLSQPPHVVQEILGAV